MDWIHQGTDSQAKWCQIVPKQHQNFISSCGLILGAFLLNQYFCTIIFGGIFSLPSGCCGFYQCEERACRPFHDNGREKSFGSLLNWKGQKEQTSEEESSGAFPNPANHRQ